MRIDHVILAATDLEAATTRAEAALGLRAAGGGRHDGLGTENRVIPAGGGYVEVLAIADPDEAAGSELGRALLARIGQGEGLLGWAVAVPDVDAEAERLGVAVTEIGREGMTARLAGLAEAMAEPCLPFFIQRDPGVGDPGGEGGPGIGWVEVAGHQGRLAGWLGEAGEALPIRLVGGEPALRAAGIGAATLT